MEAAVDRPMILEPAGIRERLVLYDLIGKQYETERGIDGFVKGTTRRKTGE